MIVLSFPRPTAVTWVRCLAAFVFVCWFVVFVCFPRDISKTDEARLTKLDTEMFYHESLKPIYFGSRSRGTKTSRCRSPDGPQYRHFLRKSATLGIPRGRCCCRPPVFACVELSASGKKHCRRGSRHSCECWLLLVFTLFYL